MTATVMPIIRPRSWHRLVLPPVYVIGRAIRCSTKVCATRSRSGKTITGVLPFPGAEYRYKPTAAALLAEANVFVDQSFRRREASLPPFPVLMELRLLLGVCQIGGGGEMNEGAELATAGLVVAFAAVLLVASHLFIESQSARQLVKGSIDLKITTNTIASWL